VNGAESTTNWWPLLIAVVIAYVLGSIPSSYVIGRALRGIDLREHGSGNLGATNVFRVMGAGAAIPVVLVDVGKGALAVWLGGLPWFQAGPWQDLTALCCALAAILGHSFSPFVRFRGGKGVATAAGAFLTLAPWGALPAAGVWLLMLRTTRIMSVASLAAAIVLPVCLLVHELTLPEEHRWATFVLSLIVAALVFLRHSSNIRRLREGQERGLW